MLFSNELLGMPLHPGQIEYLEEAKEKVNVLVPSNRWGKTTIDAILHIHANFYKLGIPAGNRLTWLKATFRTANVAPAASLVEPVFLYIDQILTSSFPIRLPDGRIVTNKCQIEWFYLKDKTQSSPPMKQFFANNSYVEHRTLGMTGIDSLEGKPYGLITYDEGGRSKHLEQEVNGTFLARLFDWNGRLHITSTPDQNSPSILFHYELYQKGLNRVPGYYTLEGELRDNIFFPKKQIEEQYKLYEHNPLRDQVLYGKFVFGGGNIFSPEDILAAKDESLNDGVRKQAGHSYIISTDSAIGGDEMVHTVIDITDLELDHTSDGMVIPKGEIRLVRQMANQGNSKSPQRHMNDFVDLYDSYRDEGVNLPYVLETWNGESVRFYHDLPEHIKVNTKCYGSWQPQRVISDNENKERPKTQTVKKADVVLALVKVLAGRVLKIPAIDPNPIPASTDKSFADLSQQLAIYKEKDENLPTDRLLSLALACWMAIEGTPAQKEITFLDW